MDRTRQVDVLPGTGDWDAVDGAVESPILSSVPQPNREASFFHTRVSQPVQSQTGKMFELPGTVAKTFGLHAHPVQQGQVQIGERRIPRVDDMPARFQATVTSPHQQGRQVLVAVAVAIAKPTTVNDHTMIEKSGIALFDFFELADVVSEQLSVEEVDLRQLIDPLRISPMMG